MNLNDLKAKLDLELKEKPQVQYLALAAVDGIRQGIAQLASIGYQAELMVLGEDGTPPSPVEYPKMLYLAGAPDLTVEDEVEERNARGLGYAGKNDPAPGAAPAVQAATAADDDGDTE